MVLRRWVRRKNGTPHTDWSLVESYRTARGSPQRVVAYLGELKPSEEDGWTKRGAHLDGKDVPWSTVAAILAITRFCEPSRELHIEEKWYRRTDLDELIDVAPEKVHTDRLHEGLDQWLPHKEAIEKLLRQRFGELFTLQCDLLLDDTTRTYFEGDLEGCSMAQRDYARDSRPDRPQVCIGLVVPADGFPLGYEVFSSNTHDSTTVQATIEALEKKYGTRLYELAKIQRGDFVLPALTQDGLSKKIRLRQVTEPDEPPAVLLHRLGLELPRRLRRFDELVTQLS